MIRPFFYQDVYICLGRLVEFLLLQVGTSKLDGSVRRELVRAVLMDDRVKMFLRFGEAFFPHGDPPEIVVHLGVKGRLLELGLHVMREGRLCFAVVSLFILDSPELGECQRAVRAFWKQFYCLLKVARRIVDLIQIQTADGHLDKRGIQIRFCRGPASVFHVLIDEGVQVDYCFGPFSLAKGSVTRNELRLAEYRTLGRFHLQFGHQSADLLGVTLATMNLGRAEAGGLHILVILVLGKDLHVDRKCLVDLCQEIQVFGFKELDIAHVLLFAVSGKILVGILQAVCIVLVAVQTFSVETQQVRALWIVFLLEHSTQNAGGLFVFLIDHQGVHIVVLQVHGQRITIKPFDRLGENILRLVILLLT